MSTRRRNVFPGVSRYRVEARALEIGQTIVSSGQDHNQMGLDYAGSHSAKSVLSGII